MWGSGGTFFIYDTTTVEKNKHTIIYNYLRRGVIPYHIVINQWS